MIELSTNISDKNKDNIYFSNINDLTPMLIPSKKDSIFGMFTTIKKKVNMEFNNNTFFFDHFELTNKTNYTINNFKASLYLKLHAFDISRVNHIYIQIPVIIDDSVSGDTNEFIINTYNKYKEFIDNTSKITIDHTIQPIKNLNSIIPDNSPYYTVNNDTNEYFSEIIFTNPIKVKSETMLKVSQILPKEPLMYSSSKPQIKITTSNIKSVPKSTSLSSDVKSSISSSSTQLVSSLSSSNKIPGLIVIYNDSFISFFEKGDDTLYVKCNRVEPSLVQDVETSETELSFKEILYSPFVVFLFFTIFICIILVCIFYVFKFGSKWYNY